MNAYASVKIALAFLLWIIAPTILGALLGGLVGRWFGVVAGLIIGVIYAVIGMTASEKLPLDIYEGRLMMREEDNELVEILDDLAHLANIPAPDIYILALDHPNVLAWATTSGRSGFTRIGISPDLRSVLGPGELQAAMAVALCRINNGEAALLGRAASLAGLALQAVYSPFTNKTLGFMRRDPDTGLTPVGTTLLTLMAPLCRATLAVTDPTTSWLESDRSAQKLLGTGIPVGSALRKLAGATGLSGSGALRGYNPALIGLYVVSPLERLVARSSKEAVDRRMRILEDVARYRKYKDETGEIMAKYKADLAAAEATGTRPPRKPELPPPPPSPPKPDELGWSARVAAWIADVVPLTEQRAQVVAPNAVIETE